MPIGKPVKVTLGGKPCVVGTTFFELEHGVTPSRGVVTMTDPDARALKRENTGHDLVINDGESSVTIKSLYIDRVETVAPVPAKSAKVDAIVGVHLEDPRSLWRQQSITGQYNVLREDGGTTYVANTVSGATPYTWAQLVKKCTDALGLGIDVSIEVDWTPQNIRWEFAPIPSALAALLQPVGYTIVWHPQDDTYEIVDLTETGGPAKLSKSKIISTITHPKDIAHDRPATAQVAFRIMRSKEFNFQAVMQHDGLTASGDAATSYADGEWVVLGTVLGDWGVSSAAVNQFLYSCFASNAPRNLIKRLGDGDLGRARLDRIYDQAYRFYRINATDKATTVPLLPLRAETGVAAGLETYLAAKIGSITWHAETRAAENVILAGGKSVGRYTEVTGVPPFKVTHINKMEGVVKVHTPPRVNVGGIEIVKNSGRVKQDYQLVPPTMRIEVGYLKKFSNSNDTTADYYLRTKDLKSPNNGNTKTFLAPHAFLREVYDSDSADFTQVNKADLDTAADAFLDRYAKSFETPEPIETLLVGANQIKLSSTVTGIRWDASDGVTTMVRQFAPISALALNPAARAKQFAIAAESAVLMNPSGLAGGAGGFDLGSLNNHAPILKDHGTGDRGEGNSAFPTSSFINEGEVGLLVAADMTMPKSKEKQCPGKRQITKSPGGRPDPTDLLGGKPQISGGSANGVGSKAGG